MHDERVCRVRQLPDGEELVAYEEPAPAPLVGEEDPRAASAERRHRALAERRLKPRNPWQSNVAPPPAR